MYLPPDETPSKGWKYKPEARIASVPKYSLVFLVDLDRRLVLLGYKKRGFGAHLYNGFGGKPEKGEDMRQCAIRELEEESGLQCSTDSLRHMGEFTISRSLPAARHVTIDIAVFISTRWQGQEFETEEMRPQWYSIDEKQLPFTDMWPEAQLYLLPLLTSATRGSAQKLKAYYEYHYFQMDEVEHWRRVGEPLPIGQVEGLAGWSHTVE